MRDEVPAWERRAARIANVVEELRIKRQKAIKPKRSRSPLQYVYFVKSQEFVKIGWATSMETRMNNFQVGNPHAIELLALMTGGPAEETMLHAIFWPDHHRGEWFKLSPVIQSLVDAIQHLDPIEARAVAGEWCFRNGAPNMRIFKRNVEALRKRESNIANLVVASNFPVVLPDA